MKKVGHSDQENSVIDAWHEIQYYLPRAITAKWVKGIFTIFVISLQCKTCEGKPPMSPFCKGFHTPSPMRCSTPPIDSQSPSLCLF